MFVYILTMVNTLLGQVQLEGLQKAADTSPLNGALVGFIIILLAGIIYLFKEYKGVQKDLKSAQKTHIDKLEDIRKEMGESEKETLKVLNGVSSILEIGDKMGQNDTHKIIEKLKYVEDKITQSIKNLNNTIINDK